VRRSRAPFDLQETPVAFLRNLWVIVTFVAVLIIEAILFEAVVRFKRCR